MWALGMIICVVLGFLLGFYTSTLMVMKDRRELKRIMETALKEYEKKERKTGRWIRQGGIHNMYTRYACSECGREIDMYYDFGNIPTDADVINEFPYCHCGAKMMEVDE